MGLGVQIARRRPWLQAHAALRLEPCCAAARGSPTHSLARRSPTPPAPPVRAAQAAMAHRVRWCRSVVRPRAVHTDSYSVYLVMDLVPGGSLQALLDARGGRLPEAEAAAALRGVLDALAACHAEGVCYGDVKPASERPRRRRGARACLLKLIGCPNPCCRAARSHRATTYRTVPAKAGTQAPCARPPQQPCNALSPNC